MKRTVLKNLIVGILIFLCAGLFAVPGIKPLIPDVSGQYVYYRDYTFSDDVYIGILHYDEGTYAVRFYSCKNGITLKDITIYVTMNTSSDFIDLTGERIVGTTGTADVEILNYLHDFLYEFGGRRKKQNGKDFSDTLIIFDDYAQFGGSVNIYYDFYIPIFNISRIQSDLGKTLFEVVCTGTLSSGIDTVFSGFKGIVHAENTNAGANLIPKKPDMEWIQQTDNICTLGDKAIFVSNYTALDENKFLEDIGYTFLQYYTSVLASSTDENYVLLDDADILLDDDSLFVKYETYGIQTGESQKTIKRLERIDSSFFEDPVENYSYFVLYEIIAVSSFFDEYEEYLYTIINEMTL